uniref:Uncharacterized protein n=1 Tax=Rhizophora mucronata TaxID=61149 RepID=A0A2P2Q0Y0_RHIMU
MLRGEDHKKRITKIKLSQRNHLVKFQR